MDLDALMTAVTALGGAAGAAVVNTLVRRRKKPPTLPAAGSGESSAPANRLDKLTRMLEGLVEDVAGLRVDILAAADAARRAGESATRAEEDVGGLRRYVEKELGERDARAEARIEAAHDKTLSYAGKSASVLAQADATLTTLGGTLTAVNQTMGSVDRTTAQLADEMRRTLHQLLDEIRLIRRSSV